MYRVGHIPVTLTKNIVTYLFLDMHNPPQNPIPDPT